MQNYLATVSPTPTNTHRADASGQAKGLTCLLLKHGDGPRVGWRKEEKAYKDLKEPSHKDPAPQHNQAQGTYKAPVASQHLLTTVLPTSRTRLLPCSPEGLQPANTWEVCSWENSTSSCPPNSWGQRGVGSSQDDTPNLEHSHEWHPQE